MANTRLIRIKRVPGAQCGGVVHDAYFIVKVRVSHDCSNVRQFTCVRCSPSRLIEIAVRNLEVR